MQKNEGRKDLMVNVLKLEIGHIHGVLTLRKKCSRWKCSFFHLTGLACIPLSWWDKCTDLDWIQHTQLSAAPGMEAVIPICDVWQAYKVED